MWTTGKKREKLLPLEQEGKRGGEMEREKESIVGISWRQFELPVKRLKAELCGWQLHFADRP